MHLATLSTSTRRLVLSNSNYVSDVWVDSSARYGRILPYDEEEHNAIVVARRGAHGV